MSSTNQPQLRKQAEQQLHATRPQLDIYTPDELNALVHELQVHQIELEIQNEELRRVQADLEDSRRMYANLFDYAPVGYVILNRNKQITEVNATAADMLTVARKKLLNTYFFQIVASGSRELFLLWVNEAQSSGIMQSFEVPLVRSDDTVFHAYLECVTAPQANGAVRIAFLDITDRKQAEEKRVELAIERENVQRLQEFLSDAAHDLRTPLSIVINYLYLIASEPVSENQKKRIAEIQQQVMRLSHMLENMFHLSALDSSTIY